jgi:hypothetical protein
MARSDGAELVAAASVRGNQNSGTAGETAPKIYGPLTTSDLRGAGGPANQWDIWIRNALRRGDAKAAADLQASRAKLAITFETLEPVWVPTPHQRLMLALRGGAAANGVCAVAA